MDEGLEELEEIMRENYGKSEPAPHGITERELYELEAMFPYVLAQSKVLDRCIDLVEDEIRDYCCRNEKDRAMARDWANSIMQDINSRSFRIYRNSVKEIESVEHGWMAWIRRKFHRSDNGRKDA